jgi:hypothetical protein
MLRFWKKKTRKSKIPSGKEQRREPRLEDVNELTIEPREAEKLGLERRKYYARTRDASPSGLKLECEVPFPVDTALDIRLQSPKTRKLIQATGKVKWVTELEEGKAYEIGLEFVDTSISAIMDLLEHIYKA